MGKRKIPKENTEYIYNLDVMWDKHVEIPIVKGTIVENVELLEFGEFKFRVKGYIKRYSCHYGWAFIENTKRNIKLLKQIENELLVQEKQELKISKLRDKLDWLFEEDEDDNGKRDVVTD